MKAALPIWAGRVAPVFDVSREALILTITDRVVTARRIVDIETSIPAAKLDRLTALGIETLVCGAITASLQHELSRRGIRVIAFVAGDIQEVEQSLLQGRLPNPLLMMPGCCVLSCHNHRGRGRHGRLRQHIGKEIK